MKRKCLCKCNEKTNWLTESAIYQMSDERITEKPFIHLQVSFHSWCELQVTCLEYVCSVSCLYLLRNKTVTILLVDYSNVDGFGWGFFVYITLRLKKIGVPSPFFNLSGSIFQFQSNHFCLCLQRCLPSPLLLSGSLVVEPSQASTQELCSKGCFQIPEDWIFCHGVFSVLFKQQAQPT